MSDRIREMEPTIHAWVQVQPQKPIGHGKLSGILFGVKDIIETRRLSTEHGSPIYKGRIGSADAAIVRDVRRRGAIIVGKDADYGRGTAKSRSGRWGNRAPVSFLSA